MPTDVTIDVETLSPRAAATIVRLSETLECSKELVLRAMLNAAASRYELYELGIPHAIANHIQDRWGHHEVVECARSLWLELDQVPGVDGDRTLDSRPPAKDVPF